METMQQPTVNHSTFTLERNFPATPERVFSAFSDPAKKIRWFADGIAVERDRAGRHGIILPGVVGTPVRVIRGSAHRGRIHHDAAVDPAQSRS